jgi:hypothetical protein
MSWKETYQDCFTTEQEVNVIANNETVNQNVLKFTGTIEVVAQYAEITEVTATSNMTNVYADIWDGTNSKNLTKSDPGSDFSGLCAGSFFSKLGILTEEYIVNIASENRIGDLDNSDIGHPFLITAKAGVDNFIRFNYTTNTVLNFKMHVFFKYRTVNGGTIEFV